MDTVSHSEILHTLIALSIVSGASVVGSISFALGKRLQMAHPYLIGGAAGALLGTAVTHMLPEAMERVGVGNRLSLLLVTGFLISFFLERLLWILFRKGGVTGPGEHIHLGDESFHHDHERNRQGHAGLMANILFRRGRTQFHGRNRHRHFFSDWAQHWRGDHDCCAPA